MKKKLKNYLIVSLILGTLILRGDSCGSGSGLVSDPNFDVWCSDTLCAWQVDEGTIEQAPTWHAEDFGVELVGAPVQISQVLDIESTGGQCFEFNLMSDVETSSAVWVGIDFDQDGVADTRQWLTSGRFQQVSYVIPEPEWFYRARLIIRKEGEGRAILAEMNVARTSECAGDRVDIARIDGAPCDEDAECASGHCGEVRTFFFQQDPSSTKRCGGCTGTADCSEGLACTQSTITELGASLSCEPPSSLGEACISGDSCQSGICCGGVCSECCDGQGCGDTEVCERNNAVAYDTSEMSEADLEFLDQIGGPSSTVRADDMSLPFQCSPGAGRSLTGDVCWVDSDCASGVCLSDKAFKACLWDRTPCESSADCSLFTAFCMPLGEYDGICQ